EITECRAMAESCKLIAHLRKDGFGPVAETEERLFTTELRAGLCDRNHFVGRHGVRAGLIRVFAERAVAAIIAAEVRERNEDFLGVSDAAAFDAVAQVGRRRKE